MIVKERRLMPTDVSVIYCDTCRAETLVEAYQQWPTVTIPANAHAEERKHHFCSYNCLATWADEKARRNE